MLGLGYDATHCDSKLPHFTAAHTMKMLLLVAAIISTIIATLTAITFCLGMGANASPAEIRMLKTWMGGFSLLGVAGVVAGILLMRAGQPGYAAGAAFLPAVIVLIVGVVAIAK